TRRFKVCSSLERQPTWCRLTYRTIWPELPLPSAPTLSLAVLTCCRTQAFFATTLCRLSFVAASHRVYRFRPTTLSRRRSATHSALPTTATTTSRASSLIWITPARGLSTRAQTTTPLTSSASTVFSNCPSAKVSVG